MKKTGVIEDIEFTHGEFGQQLTKINGKTYHTWFDFANGIHVGATVEFEEELGKLIASMPHPGNPNASIRADVASHIRITRNVETAKGDE